MVENRPWLNVLTHLVLIIGVAIVVFPVYVAFIASTQAPNTFLRGVMPLLPGDNMIANYGEMLTTGMSTSGAPPLWLMLINSTWMAIIITVVTTITVITVATIADNFREKSTNAARSQGGLFFVRF